MKVVWSLRSSPSWILSIFIMSLYLNMKLAEKSCLYSTISKSQTCTSSCKRTGMNFSLILNLDGSISIQIRHWKYSVFQKKVWCNIIKPPDKQNIIFQIYLMKSTELEKMKLLPSKIILISSQELRLWMILIRMLRTLILTHLEMIKLTVVQQVLPNNQVMKTWQRWPKAWEVKQIKDFLMICVVVLWLTLLMKLKQH